MTSEHHTVPVRVVLRGGLPVLEETAPNPVVLAALERAQAAQRGEPASPGEPPSQQVPLDDDDLDENGVPRWLGGFDPERAVVYGERALSERMSNHAGERPSS